MAQTYKYWAVQVCIRRKRDLRWWGKVQTLSNTRRDAIVRFNNLECYLKSYAQLRRKGLARCVRCAIVIDPEVK